MMHRKNRTLQRGCVLLLALLTIPAVGAIRTPENRTEVAWADKPAALTIGEFLNLHFKIAMQRPESMALNSYSLVDFYPSSDPRNALVFVIQTWHDERLAPADLRREIREFGDALTKQFESLVRLPAVNKRWEVEDPKTNFIVKHVRYSDPLETLAVTVNGETVFGDDDIAKAKSAVKSRGAVWGW